MTENESNQPKRMKFGMLMLISFLLFNLGYVVVQTIRWSNHLHGFMNGVYHFVYNGMTWVIFLLPWSLLVFALYRWRKWKRFRSQWVLAPAVAGMLIWMSTLITNPPTPQNRFKRLAQTELPNDIKHLKYHFSGGGFADYTDTYYFETSSEEVDRIILDMGLKHDKSYGFEGNFYTSMTKLPDCPDFSKWEDAKLFRGNDDREHWFYSLITNASKTKVYIQISCI